MSGFFQGGVLSHFCSFNRGEPITGLNRENVDVDVDTEDTLYSGRVAILEDNSGTLEAHEAVLSDSVQLYFVHRGVEHPDVGGADAVPGSDGQNGVLGEGMVSLRPLNPGLKVTTSEYDSTDVDNWSLLDDLVLATASGELVAKETYHTDAQVIARLLRGEHSTSGDVDCIEVEVLRAVPGM